MTSHFNKFCRETLLCLPLMFFLSLLSTSFCSATVNKSTITVLVSTTKQNNWYDESDSSLHTFAVCDEGKGSGSTYNKYVPCNTDGVHDDYYSTDTNDERNTYPASENFTIKASASASSGSMSKIKFEWLANITGTPSESSWQGAALESYTCSGTGTCSICVVGGTCAHPVIPQADLGVYPDTGAQRKLFFRVTFSSSSGDNITTGWDSTLDKFYRFVICGPTCSAHTCGQYTPTVVPASVQNPADFCNGLNDTNGFYTLNWKYDKMPSKADQTYYKVSVRKKGTTNPIYAYESNSKGRITSFKVPSSWLSYGNVYEWQVQVKFKGQGCEWNVTSPWSSGSTDINVPHRFPVPRINVTNASSADCLAGGCYQSDNITFNGSTSTTSTGSPTYAWTLDGASYSGASFSKVFTTTSHKVRLKVTDSDGHSCTTPDKSFVLQTVKETCPTAFGASLVSVYKPSNLCGGLDDIDGYYAVSWKIDAMPFGYRQINYELTIRNKADASDTHTTSVSSSSTLFRIPTSWIDYNKTYEWKVKARIASASGSCPMDVESPWSSSGMNIVVPHRYPVPVLSVKNASGADCLAGKCYTEEDLTFDASSSKISTGSATYNWVLDSSSYSGLSFLKNFTDKDHIVNLKVTDSDGYSCTSPNNSFSLIDKTCPGNPTVALSNWSCNNFCDELDYILTWNNENLPAGAKQTRFDVTVRNKNIPAKTHTITVNSSARIFSIPSSWLEYDSTYEWQVKVYLDATSGKCSWSAISPWSSGTLNIAVPSRFPTASLSVKNETGVNCLSGGCLMGEEITFDARDVSIPVDDFTYAWTLDGVSYDTPFFTTAFDTKDHTVSLKAINKSDGKVCIGSAKTFNLAKGQAGWTEIAPGLHSSTRR